MVRLLLTNRMCVENDMDSSSISLSVLRSSSQISPIPCFLCSADYIDWIPLGLPTKKVYRLSHKAIELTSVVLPICYILFPPCSIALSRSYSGALGLILFDTLIQLIVAPPYLTLIRWGGLE